MGTVQPEPHLSQETERVGWALDRRGQTDAERNASIEGPACGWLPLDPFGNVFQFLRSAVGRRSRLMSFDRQNR